MPALRLRWTAGRKSRGRIERRPGARENTDAAPTIVSVASERISPRLRPRQSTGSRLGRPRIGESITVGRRTTTPVANAASIGYDCRGPRARQDEDPRHLGHDRRPKRDPACADNAIPRSRSENAVTCHGSQPRRALATVDRPCFASPGSDSEVARFRRVIGDRNCRNVSNRARFAARVFPSMSEYLWEWADLASVARNNCPSMRRAWFPESSPSLDAKAR
jgi:hypothetical protein